MTKPTTDSSSSILEQKKLALLIVLIEIFCIIFHSIAGGYIENKFESERYPLWQDINVMIFVGFGFLMTFLRTYQFSAVGYTFLIGAISFQLYPIWETIWACAFDPDLHFQMHLSTTSLMFSSFCAGAVLITYGGIIGKVSGFQLILIQVIETIAYSLNERISFAMGIADVGGSMVIHSFGAVFGVVLTKIITPRDAFGHKKAESNYYSDLTAFLGSIFLWMYWPSFNAGPAAIDSASQSRAFVNTILSLSASCMITFVISILTRDEGKRFNMIDIQNATLAGGVAMGTCANMNIAPIWAILIGLSAGLVSCLGFSKLQAFLESKIGLHDTCGIMNLHCIPGILGGIWGAIAASKALDRGDTLEQLLEVYTSAGDAGWTASYQSGNQIIFLAITIGMAVISAIITGVVVRVVGQTPTSLFEDAEAFHIPRVRFEDVEELIAKLPKMPQSQVVLVTDPLNTSGHILGHENNRNTSKNQIEMEQHPMKHSKE